MGAASSTSANNTYYRKHVEDIVNNYPITATQGRWKFWSGRTIAATVNGQQHTYPIDYTIESTMSQNEEGAVDVYMSALWPNDYPVTAFRGQFNEMIWVHMIIYPNQDKIALEHTHDVSRQDVSNALPGEITATKSLLNEAVCILLRMAQQTQTRRRQTTVVATVYVDALPFFKHLGFQVTSSPVMFFYEMTGALDLLVHRCREEHLFRDADTGRIPLKKHITETLAALSNVNGPGKWEFSTGRTVKLDNGYGIRVYPINYKLTIRSGPFSRPQTLTETVQLIAMWPEQYPKTPLKEEFQYYMTRVEIEVHTDTIDILTLHNMAISLSNKVLPAEKAALAGLVSEGLCLMLRMIQRWKNLAPNFPVSIVVSDERIHPIDIDLIQKNASASLSPYHISKLQEKASKKAVQKIFEQMGFREILSPRRETLLEMESTIGELVENCEHRFAEDKEYL